MSMQVHRRDFAELLLCHLDTAYNLARWLVRDPSMAEDVVHEAFVRAVQYVSSFRGGHDLAGLLQIVRNLAYSHLEVERREPEDSQDGTAVDEAESVDPDAPGPGSGPDAILARRRNLAALANVLDALPISLRECVVLREVENLSYEDIAWITSVPTGTVVSRLSRAWQAIHRAKLDVTNSVSS